MFQVGITLGLMPLLGICQPLGVNYNLFKIFQTIACIGVCLNGANLYGYTRCRFGSHLQMRSDASNFLGKKFFSSVSLIMLYYVICVTIML